MKHLSRAPPAHQFPSFTIAKKSNTMKRIILLVCFMACCGCAGAQGWFELGTGANALKANAPIYTISSDTFGNIYAAGLFNDSNWVFAKRYVAKWDCFTHIWSQLGTGSNALNANGEVYTICSDKHGNIYAAGGFTDSTLLGRIAEGYEYVAKWDGITWSHLGAGNNPMNLFIAGVINTICVDDSGNVYAAGNFPDSSWSYYVAKWNGSTWSELGSLNANLFINSICVDDSFNVYAAGDFTDAAGHTYVAKYSPATGLWTELGTGFDSGTYELEVQSMVSDTPNHLYIALNCIHGVAYSNVFKWNGTIWNELGTLNGNSYTRAICKGDSGSVFAAGAFTDSNGYSYVGKYSSQTNAWEELGRGSNALNANHSINSICLDRYNHVFAGGAFYDTVTSINFDSYVAEYGVSTLGISGEKRGNSNWIVFPNPATNEINILYPDFGATIIFDYLIADATGRIWKSGQLNTKPGSEAKINTSDIPCGVYLLRINENIFKIVKK